MDSYGVYHWYQSCPSSDKPTIFPLIGDSTVSAARNEIGEILDQLRRQLPDIKQCCTEVSTVIGEISKRLTNIDRSLGKVTEELSALKSELILSGEDGVEHSKSVAISTDLTTIVSDLAAPKRRPKKTTMRKKMKTYCLSSHRRNWVRWKRSSVSVTSRGATSAGTTKGGRTGGAAAARCSKRQRRSSPWNLRKTAARSVGDGTKPTGEVDAWEVGARTKKKPAMRKPTPTSTARGKWSGLGGGFAARRVPNGDGGCIDTSCVRWWAGRSEERGWRLGSIVDRSGGRKRRLLDRS